MIAWALLAVFAGGLILGLVNFSLLYVTTARILETRRPVFLAMGSFFGRAAVTVVCMYFLAGGRWEKLAATFAGLLLARSVILRWASGHRDVLSVLPYRRQRA